MPPSPSSRGAGSVVRARRDALYAVRYDLLYAVRYGEHYEVPLGEVLSAPLLRLCVDVVGFVLGDPAIDVDEGSGLFHEPDAKLFYVA